MSRAWVVIKRCGRFLKFAFFCLVLTIVIFFAWRVFSTGTPKELKALTPNEKLNEAYAQKGDGLYMFTQNYDPITRADRNSGYFSVPSAVFIPDANQAQIVFRYNNSTLREVATDYSLDAPLTRGEEHFDVTLVLYLDLTPNNADDNYETNSPNVKVVRVHASQKNEGSSTLYNFYRYVFDFESAEVNLSELMKNKQIIAIHAQMYYNDDLDYSEEAYGAICLYDSRMTDRPVELTKADKKIFKEDN